MAARNVTLHAYSQERVGAGDGSEEWDVAVIGIPSEKWGEEVKAIVVLKEGSSAKAEDIIAWTKEKIASYKCPKSVDFASALPRNPSGKILRKDLREPFWDGVERRVG